MSTSVPVVRKTLNTYIEDSQISQLIQTVRNFSIESVETEIEFDQKLEVTYGFRNGSSQLVPRKGQALQQTQFVDIRRDSSLDVAIKVQVQHS